jgi:hypothetical protein
VVEVVGVVVVVLYLVRSDERRPIEHCTPEECDHRGDGDTDKVHAHDQQLPESGPMV